MDTQDIDSLSERPPGLSHLWHLIERSAFPTCRQIGRHDASDGLKSPLPVADPGIGPKILLRMQWKLFRRPGEYVVDFLPELGCFNSG